MKLQLNESQNELCEVSLENIEESKKINGITPQFRWENGLRIEFYFNQEKSSPNWLGEKLGEKLGETQQSI